VGEEAAGLALARLGRTGRRSATRRLRLPGAGAWSVDAFTEAFVASDGLPEPIARRLAGLYGTRAPAVAERVGGPGGGEVVDEATGLTAGEIAFALEAELAVSLTDVLARRTMTGIGPTLPEASVERAARVAARVDGWSDERAERELATFTGRLARFRVPSAGAPATTREEIRA